MAYTDGSKREDGQTGFGFLVANGDILAEGCGYLGELASVFQVEVLAIRKVAEVLQNMGEAGPFNIGIRRLQGCSTGRDGQTLPGKGGVRVRECAELPGRLWEGRAPLGQSPCWTQPQ